MMRTVTDALCGGVLRRIPGGRPAPASTGSGGSRPPSVELVYELLDAHADTAMLAAGLELDPRWGAHLDYIRALQREGHALLAQRCFDEAT
jgi:hypothetical protein